MRTMARMQKEGLHVGRTFHLQNLVRNLLFIGMCWLCSLKSVLYMKNKRKTITYSLYAAALEAKGKGT